MLIGNRDYAIVMLDPNGCVTAWTTGAERIKGWTANDIIGKPYAIFFPLDRRLAGDPERALAQARKDGEHREKAIRVRHDGSQFIAECLLTAIWGTNNKLHGFANTTRDITDLEETQEFFAQQERSAALGRLAAGMAHDFNNVLQVVSVSAAMIDETPDDVELVRKLGSRLMQVASRGAAISNRLLDFARHDGARPESLRLDKLFNSIRDLLGPLLPASISIRTIADADIPQVMADPAQLETVLVNLATNARDAMPDGGTIRITATVVDVDRTSKLRLREGRYVRISIYDNGNGMDRDTLSRVTQPFFTTKARGRGTGLGLTMAKIFAQQSRGGFSINSEQGMFTEVFLWLPVAVEDHPSRSDADQPKVKQATSGVIMIVDDDELVRETISVTLQRRGLTTIEMGDGENALRLLTDHSVTVDALLVDYTLPGMSGIKVICEAIRLRPHLPVLLVTGNIGEMLSGTIAVRMLRKPFSPGQLINDVSLLLNRGMA